MAINKIIEIFRGDSPIVTVTYVTEDENGVQKAEDISGDTGEAKFPGESSDVVVAGVFDTDGTDGVMNYPFTSTKSKALKRDNKQTFFTVLTDGTSKERTVKFEDLLTVDDRDFK